MRDTPAIAARLTRAQRQLVLASEPDDITGEEGVGVEISGSRYRASKALQDHGLGFYTHGSPIADMYWNNATGLAVRNFLQEKS